MTTEMRCRAKPRRYSFEEMGQAVYCDPTNDERHLAVDQTVTPPRSRSHDGRLTPPVTQV
jgi:hypothetical protein